MLWLNFAPLLTIIQRRHGVSELLASTLVLVFPLLYVLLSLPAGALIDRRGYRLVVGAGAVVMAAFSCLRIHDASFWALLAGQVGIAVAQPVVVNGISKLVSDRFSPEQGAIATGLGTMGMFIGMAVGMAASPALADALGLRGAMVVFAAITVVLGVAFVAFARENRAAADEQEAVPTGGFRRLVGQRDLLLVFALSFLGLGFFNGLTTWLEGILAQSGISAVDAGMVGGLLIMGGIVGAVVIPALSDRFRRRKPFVILCAVGALAALYVQQRQLHAGARRGARLLLPAGLRAPARDVGRAGRTSADRLGNRHPDADRKRRRGDRDHRDAGGEGRCRDLAHARSADDRPAGPGAGAGPAGLRDLSPA